MDRGVHNGHIVVACNGLGRERQALYSFDEIAIHLFANGDDKFGAGGIFYLSHRADTRYLLNGIHIVRSNHLRAVAPVGFVAVVDLGVVRGCYHYAALATQVADGKRDFRGGSERFE